jgi:hypothetical protein
MGAPVKVNINGHSHQVEVEADGDDLPRLVRVAKRLWRDTVQPQTGPAGPAFGFQAEVRSTPSLFPMDADGQ